MRSVNEWRGKTDDSRPPPRVFARVFERHGGICCLTGLKIAAGERWELHHVIALSLGGENRERNLAPALVVAHKIKSAADRRVQKKLDRVRKKHLGVKKPRRITAWRRFNGDKVFAGRER